MASAKERFDESRKGFDIRAVRPGEKIVNPNTALEQALREREADEAEEIAQLRLTNPAEAERREALRFERQRKNEQP